MLVPLLATAPAHQVQLLLGSYLTTTGLTAYCLPPTLLLTNHYLLRTRCNCPLALTTTHLLLTLRATYYSLTTYCAPGAAAPCSSLALTTAVLTAYCLPPILLLTTYYAPGAVALWLSLLRHLLLTLRTTYYSLLTTHQVQLPLVAPWLLLLSCLLLPTYY